MTLIELMVAMAIIGAIFAIAATGLRSVFGVNLKSGAAHLASTLRYLSIKAVTEHKYLRMVYDLDGQTYHAEESPDPYLVSPDEEKETDKETLQKGSASKGDTLDLSDEAKKEKDKGAGFSAVESHLLEPVKFPTGVSFKDVSVSYIPEKKEAGRAYTYFFPDGYATPTMINLKNEDDEDHYSVEVLPLSGRVKVLGEYREMERK